MLVTWPAVYLFPVPLRTILLVDLWAIFFCSSTRGAPLFVVVADRCNTVAPWSQIARRGNGFRWPVSAGLILGLLKGVHSLELTWFSTSMLIPGRVSSVIIDLAWYSLSPSKVAEKLSTAFGKMGSFRVVVEKASEKTRTEFKVGEFS